MARKKACTGLLTETEISALSDDAVCGALENETSLDPAHIAAYRLRINALQGDTYLRACQILDSKLRTREVRSTDRHF